MGRMLQFHPKIVDFIAFDMGALVMVTSDEYTVSICAKDASGPYHKGYVNN